MTSEAETTLQEWRIPREMVEQYLPMMPYDIRSSVADILERLEIVQGPQPSLRLESARVPVTDINNINLAVELLLHRSGHYLTLGDRAPQVVFALSMILTDMFKKWKPAEAEEKPLSVEIKHVSEREELAWQIYKRITEGRIIKTFIIRQATKEVELGIYCYDNGIYVPCEKTLEAETERLARESGEDISMKVSRWIVNEVMARIRRATQERLHREPLVIAFKNLLFDWETYLKTGRIRGAVRPFDPDIIVYHRIPHRLAIEKLDRLEGLVKYDEELAVSQLEDVAKVLCPKTLKAFKEWVGDKWILLFEIIGYTLYPRYDLHKAVMLIGEGRNGKSTYLRFVKDILGRENVASVSLQDLTDETKRFAVAELYHKLANIYADLPNRALKHTGRFKILTGEDTIMAERKFRDPFPFVNYAKLLFSANELPRVSDMTIAFWRRWLVIEFPNQFPLNPGFYEETFTEEEKEGAILVGLLAFREVMKRKKFSFEETEADYKEMWLRETNSVYAFLRDLLEGEVEEYEAEKDPTGRVETKQLYSVYVQWCEAEDREAVAKKTFTEELERLGYPRVKIGNTYYYKGLWLKPKNLDGIGLERHL